MKKFKYARLCFNSPTKFKVKPVTIHTKDSELVRTLLKKGYKLRSVAYFLDNPKDGDFTMSK